MLMAVHEGIQGGDAAVRNAPSRYFVTAGSLTASLQRAILCRRALVEPSDCGKLNLRC